MKKTVIFFLIISMLSCVSACKKEQNAETADAPEETYAVPEENTQTVLPSQLYDGSYAITVQSSSSMFRVVKCELHVSDGEMHAVMTMGGQGYGKLYMGTAEEALNAEEDDFIPFEMNADGEKTFTVPVEALNQETDCAAWSIKKEQWYDRVLIFESADIPAEAFKEE